MRQSQCDLILEYLCKGNSLTSLEALDRFKCMRLASRINDLKVAGHKIRSVTICDPKTKKNYSQYSLERKPEQLSMTI